MGLKFLHLAITLFCSLAGASALFAHHSFIAEFDRELVVDIAGTVTNVEWANPHARFYIDVEDDSGEIIHWNLELGSPNILMRQGWRRDSLKPGDMVTVTGWRARNDPHVANVKTVHLADGTRMFAVSSDGND